MALGNIYAVRTSSKPPSILPSSLVPSSWSTVTFRRKFDIVTEMLQLRPGPLPAPPCMFLPPRLHCSDRPRLPPPPDPAGTIEA